MSPPRFLSLAAALTLLSGPALAQGRGDRAHGSGDRGSPAGTVPPGFGGAFGGSGMSRPALPRPASPSAEARGGLQLGPPGRWWDNRDTARSLGLNSGQQRRLDDVFSGNRDTLVKLYSSLQREESQLSRLARARDLDEREIFNQIDRVTAARGELEKANAHMLLQLRKELTPEQTARLDDLPNQQ